MARLVQFLVLGAASLLGVTMGTGYRAGHGVQPAPPTGSEPGIQVRRLHPLSPGDALASFRLETGFQLELVAHEPSVKDPVAAVYDEDGRLYVCEMGDYPGHGETPEGIKGRVSQLLVLRRAAAEGSGAWIVSKDCWAPDQKSIWGIRDAGGQQKKCTPESNHHD